jgi:DNA-binding HxlR family transcriptional regulator
MENPQDVEKDRQRAEVFDALGHPTRIVLLKVLSEGALGFADLKKKTAIESSGHLQHHLTKLNGLIKTDEYGKYCLSEQGKDAWLTVQTVENVSSSRETKGSEKPHLRFSNIKVGLKSWALLLSALLIVSSAVAFYEYTQAVALQREIERFREIDVEAIAYYNEFGVIPDVNVNSSFSPPVSVYRALQLGLQAGGWNKTSLYGMRVGAYLRTWKKITDPDVYNFTVPVEIDISPITVPPSDYSPVYGEGVVYRYVWQIVVTEPSGYIRSGTLVPVVD